MSRELAQAEQVINAPPAVVWGVLVDLERYAAWNRLTPSVTGELRVGAVLTLRVALTPGWPTAPMRVTLLEVEPGRCLRWTARLGPRSILAAERHQTLEPLSGGRTRYTTADVLSGALAPTVVRLLGGTITRGFDALAQGLAARCEAIAG